MESTDKDNVLNAQEQQQRQQTQQLLKVTPTPSSNGEKVTMEVETTTLGEIADMKQDDSAKLRELLKKLSQQMNELSNETLTRNNVAKAVKDCVSSVQITMKKIMRLDHKLETVSTKTMGTQTSPLFNQERGKKAEEFKRKEEKDEIEIIDREVEKKRHKGMETKRSTRKEEQRRTPQNTAVKTNNSKTRGKPQHVQGAQGTTGNAEDKAWEKLRVGGRNQGRDRLLCSLRRRRKA